MIVIPINIFELPRVANLNKYFLVSLDKFAGQQMNYITLSIYLAPFDKVPKTFMNVENYCVKRQLNNSNSSAGS